MGRIIGIILGIIAIVNGFGILADDECNTVSFGGRGGRVIVATCFSDSSGVMPGAVAGLGMIVLGAAVAYFSVKRR